MRPIPVSRRRALFNADPNSLIRLYTRQHKDAWAVAQDLGYFSGDHGILDIDEDGHDFTFHKPYDWMRDEMAKVIPNFSGERPMWAYPKRPLNKRWFKIRPNNIQFTVLVPRNRILFSDYELWHHPLNNWLISDSEAEDDIWWEQNPRPDPSHTWHKCLDICQDYRGKKCDWLRATDQIQACVDRIYVNEIVAIKYP